MKDWGHQVKTLHWRWITLSKRFLFFLISVAMFTCPIWKTKIKTETSVCETVATNCLHCVFLPNTETFLETQCGEDTKDIGESQAWSHLLKKHYWKRKKIVKFEVLMKENKAMTKLKTIWAWLWNVFHPVLHMHCITVKKYYPFVAQDNTYALWNKPNNE